MDLLQIDHRAPDVEPHTSVALERWLVLPSLNGEAITGHDAVFTSYSDFFVGRSTFRFLAIP
ncbi:hypothetical protein ACX80D_04505 [Arthrobacter sp. Sr24]